MSWFWYLVFAIAAFVVVRSLFKGRGSSNKPDQGTGDDEFKMMFERLQQRQIAAQDHPQEQLKPELKPYVTRLCRVHATVGSFASPETRTIGQEIYDKYGHDTMVAVCDEVRRVLGGGPARDLEYKWGGIGIWMG